MGMNSFILGVLYFSPDRELAPFLVVLRDIFMMIDAKFHNFPVYEGGNFNARVGVLNQRDEFSL